MENKNYYPKHDFEFEISKLFVDETLTPYKKVSFNLNPEMLQDFAITEEEYVEIMSEKLKQDFKKLIYEKLTKK